MTDWCRTYYVSQKHGNDQNSGRSSAEPYASLFAINRLKLQPGDRILLENNSVFAGQFLQITDSGTKDLPIVIGAYEDRTQAEQYPPVIAANGQGIWYQDYGCELDSPAHTRNGYVSSAVLLYDAEYVTLQDLELTNSGQDIIGERYSAPDKMNRTGVAVAARDKGVRSGITLRNLVIHDVNGNVYDKHMNNGGIYMTAQKPIAGNTEAARFRDVTVEGCYVDRVSRWGIAVGYTYAHAAFAGAELSEEAFLKYGHENITIRNNYVKRSGGDAITVMYALRPVVEHNCSDSAAQEINDRIYQEPQKRGGKVAAAIWPWKCKDALFRFNEAADTRLNQDGMDTQKADEIILLEEEER